MILPDLNLLLYAYNPHARQHSAARQWWQSVLNGEELIGLPNEVTFGFIRIATNSRLGRARVEFHEARRVVEEWLALPHARQLLPNAGHFARVMELMKAAMGSGPLLSDAILAAHAMEHRAKLCTNDGDFARFPGLTWENPLTTRAAAS